MIKNKMKLILALLCICCFGFTNIQQVHAEEATDGIEIELTTDKSEYTLEDSIDIHVTLKNKSQSMYEDVNLDIDIPKSIKVNQGNLHEEIAKLNGNAKKQYHIKGTISSEINERKESSNNTIIYFVLLLGGAAIGIVFIRKHKKSLNSIIILFLIGNLLCSSFVDVHAETNDKSSNNLIKTEEVYINEKKEKITVKCSFKNSTEKEAEDDFKGLIGLNTTINKNGYFVTEKEQITIGQPNNDIKKEPDNEIDEVEKPAADVSGNITLNQQLDEKGFFITDKQQLTFSGTASDENGVSEIMYSIDDNSGNILKEKANGKENWDFTHEFRTGTSNVTVDLIDNLNNHTTFEFKVAKTSDEIKASDNTYLMSENDVNGIENAYYDSITIGKDTADISDDGIYIILNENASFTQQLKAKNQAPYIGDILFAAPSDKLYNGLNLKIENILEPSNPEFRKVYNAPLDDSDFEVVLLKMPSYDELLNDDVLFVYGDDAIDEEPYKLLYFMTPDGKNILNENNNEISTLADDEDIFGFKPKIVWEDDGLKVSFDNILYDKDRDKNTEYDQVTLKGEMVLDNLRPHGVFEYKVEDILPKEIGIRADYDFKVNTKLAVGGTYDGKELVKSINLLYQGKKGPDGLNELNKSTIGGFEFSGIDMDKEIYLGTIGIQLGSGYTVIGTLSEVGRLSVAPVVTVSLVMDLEGELKLKASYEYDYSSYNESSIILKQSNFEGLSGKLEMGILMVTKQWNKIYDLKIGNEVYASKHDKKHKPQVIQNYQLEGELKAGIGLGANIGIMFLNIIPASIGAGAGIEGEAKASVTAKYINGEPVEGNIIEGSGSITAGIYGKYALKFVGKIDDLKVGIDFSDKFWLFKFLEKKFEFGNITDVDISVYEDDKYIDLVKNKDYMLTLKGNNAEYHYDLKDGIVHFDDIPIGDYKVEIKDKDNNTIYDQPIRISKENKTFYLYLKKTEKPITTVPLEAGNFTLKSKPSQGISASVSLVANEDSVISYDDHDEAGFGIAYKKLLKKGDEFVLGEVLDITIHEGSVSLVSSHEEVDVVTLFTKAELGHEAVFGFVVMSGESLTIDNQEYNGDILYNMAKYWVHSPDIVSYTRHDTDYWWNKYMGFEIREEEKNYDEITNLWTSIKSCNTHKYSVHSGELHIAIPYRYKDKLVYS